MRRFAAASTACVLAAVAAIASQRSWTGRVITRGWYALPQFKRAFVTDVNRTVYEIANQDFPRLGSHPGHGVRLTGILNGDTITISKLETDQPLAQLRRVFPNAGGFSNENGEPPHFDVYASDPVQHPDANPIGFAFWTTDVVPDEKGYDGPIVMIVGMDTAGILSGVVVISDTEPYGSFSVEPPAFAAQFRGKSIRDPFRVGDDVDAVSRASISVASAARAIRDSAVIVARRYLAPDAMKRQGG